MKNRIMWLFFVCALTKLAAGDVAVFVDEGFTKDGKYYLFGQYGQTDSPFQGYGSIYVVDIEKNEYKNQGIFRANPKKKTKNVPGKTVYEELKTKISYELKKYERKLTESDAIFYIRMNSPDSSEQEIKFRPFGKNVKENQTYVIKMHKNIESEKNRSSFYIEVEKHDEKGNLIASEKVGHEEIKRENITDYIVDRVLLDRQNKSVVFVVEKHEKNKSGINIRYMVECARLNEKFF